MKAAFIPNIKNVKNFSHIEILDILNDIKSGKFRRQIEQLRLSTDYKTDKAKLPAWSFNGTFNESVSNNGFLESNGLFHFDIDHIDDVHDLKKELITLIPEIFALWISPSGKGLKGLIRIPDDLIHNDVDFKKAFKQIRYYFDDFGVFIDEACKDVRRLCFVCYDSDIYINQDAPCFLFDAKKWNEESQIVTNNVKSTQFNNKSYANDETRYIDWCCRILERASPGSYHNARLAAGKLAGGYIASGLVNESEVEKALLQLSDNISASAKDSPDIIRKEHKAILSGIANGKLSPVKPIQKTPPSNVYNIQTGESFYQEYDLSNMPPIPDYDDFYPSQSITIDSCDSVLEWSNGDDLADNAKAPNYLINNILESDSHGILMGASQSYKSFIVLEMAHCICTGSAFMGNDVFNTGKVLYVCGEGRGALERRIKAIKIVKGSFNNNLMVLDTSISIDSKTAMAKLHDLINKFTPALVIIDTFSSLNSGTNENDNSEVGAVLKMIKETCRNGITSSIIVHHLGKDEARGARGAGCFKDNSDFAFSMKRAGIDVPIATFSCEKMKDGDPFNEITIQSRIVELGLTRQDGTNTTSLVLFSSEEPVSKNKKQELTSREFDIFSELRNAIDNHAIPPTDSIRQKFKTEPDKCPRFVVHVDKWRDFAHRVISADKTHAKNVAFNRAIDKLIDCHRIGFFDDHYWLIR